jgi:hypothetical protein
MFDLMRALRIHVALLSIGLNFIGAVTRTPGNPPSLDRIQVRQQVGHAPHVDLLVEPFRHEGQAGSA